jgi:hypothetical protein
MGTRRIRLIADLYYLQMKRSVKKLILTLELHDGGKQDFLDQGEVSSKHS